ncbi:MAG: ImmA/IrrE family metallo-endopeptidase, partial [Mucilaginibacter sp.]|uniref:ImmA/IrrE family metallo-endopeptidase n=1 Tax=Mucilaginibacter sp. TaxID=1882438 RepID=UPI0034E5CC68
TFANELLLPTVDIASHLSNGITIDKLIELKQYWKVSMQAILYKAKSLKFIADNQYNYLVRQMGYLGYRTKEPVDIEPDNISLLKELIDTHIQEMGYTKEGLADLLNINLEELNDVYFGVKPRVKTKLLRVVI